MLLAVSTLFSLAGCSGNPRVINQPIDQIVTRVRDIPPDQNFETTIPKTKPGESINILLSKDKRIAVQEVRILLESIEPNKTSVEVEARTKPAEKKLNFQLKVLQTLFIHSGRQKEFEKKILKYLEKGKPFWKPKSKPKKSQSNSNPIGLGVDILQNMLRHEKKQDP